MCSQEPLISIMLINYNGAKSLPWALASLLAQTYQNWECIAVDDGSTDNSLAIFDAFCDPRLRLIRLPHNQGRAHARQTALDAARGIFITNLDADDWLLTDKIKAQYEVLAADNDLALVSSGVVFVDSNNDLAGVSAKRGPDHPTKQLFNTVSKPPVRCNTSMLRLDHAKTLKYDDRMDRAEDSDFVMRYLQDSYYCILPVPLYAYSRPVSACLKNELVGHRFNRITFRKFLLKRPYASCRSLIESCLKSVACQLVRFSRLEPHYFARRFRNPDPMTQQRFDEARLKVSSLTNSTFPDFAATAP